MANDPLTVPAASVSPVAPIGAGAPPSRYARKLAALDLQLRQQGAVIEALKLKLRHATDRAEADERLLAEQAGLLGFDLEAAVRLKMEKNRKRPFRHGGKRL